jgi:hypothetical protein
MSMISSQILPLALANRCEACDHVLHRYRWVRPVDQSERWLAHGIERWQQDVRQRYVLAYIRTAKRAVGYDGNGLIRSTFICLIISPGLDSAWVHRILRSDYVDAL